MTCEDCLYYNFCANQYGDTDYFDDEDVVTDVERYCNQAEDKSLYVKLPCKVGDEVYYITAWDKYANQPDHEQCVKEICIKLNDVIFLLDNDVRLRLKDYNKWWFTNKEKWIKAKEIYQKSYKESEQALREVKENEKYNN